MINTEEELIDQLECDELCFTKTNKGLKPIAIKKIKKKKCSCD